jgi:hypothetical protein
VTAGTLGAAAQPALRLRWMSTQFAHGVAGSTCDQAAGLAAIAEAIRAAAN